MSQMKINSVDKLTKHLFASSFFVGFESYINSKLVVH
jgi:hypothetical protein